MQTESTITPIQSKKNILLDFEKFYDKSPKIIFHFLMWFAFSVLLFSTYFIEYKLTILNSVLLTLRMDIVCLFVFYTFFYALVPWALKIDRRLATIIIILSIPAFIFCWLSIMHFISVLYYNLGIEILSGELKNAISMSAKQNFSETVSVGRMLSQTIIIISIISPFFFVKILFETIKTYNRATELQQQKLDVEIQNINIEKDFLKSQLNPHFLFNTLNNLYGLSVKKDDSAPEVILNLSDIMSYTLYESNSEKVPLEKEIEFIKNYFELEKMRYPKDKDIRLEISGDDQISGLYIAPLLTFIFVENAFKYGLKSQNPFIKQEILINDNQFLFIVENDKERISEKNKFGGIGIENIKKRLQLLYPNQHQLEIKNLENSFRIELKINL